MTTESIKISLEELPKLSIVRKDGMTTIRLSGEQLAVYDDFTVKGYTEDENHGIEFIPKGARDGRK